jgi:hypothetical protein
VYVAPLLISGVEKNSVELLIDWGNSKVNRVLFDASKTAMLLPCVAVAPPYTTEDDISLGK